jgi:hypothetical protein
VAGVDEVAAGHEMGRVPGNAKCLLEYVTILALTRSSTALFSPSARSKYTVEGKGLPKQPQYLQHGCNGSKSGLAGTHQWQAVLETHATRSRHCPRMLQQQSTLGMQTNRSHKRWAGWQRSILQLLWRHSREWGSRLKIGQLGEWAFKERDG